MALSSSFLKAQIFRRLVTKGFKVVPGYPSIMDVVDIIVDETVNHIRMFANVSGQVSITRTATVTGTAAGASPSGPVVCTIVPGTVATLTPATVFGIINTTTTKIL